MPLFDFLAYGVHGNWRLTWFPMPGATLKQVMMRADSFEFRREDIQAQPVGGNWWTPVFTLGQDSDKGGRMTPYHDIVSFVSLSRSSTGDLFGEVELRFGRMSRRATVTIEPDRQTPFMLVLHADPHEEDLASTVAVLDGVFSGGHRFTAGDFVRVFSPLRLK